MMIGKFDKDGDGYTGRIFSREWRGIAVTISPMPIKQGSGPDFVVIGDDEHGQFELGAAWKKISGKGKAYLSVKLDGPTLINAVNCALIEQQDGTFGLVWKRTEVKADEQPAAEEEAAA